MDELNNFIENSNIKKKVREDCIIQDGEILENLSNGFFSVELQNGHKLIAYLSGKMKNKNRIKVIVGDKVKLEMTPYDLGKGRIVYRYGKVDNKFSH